MNNIIKDLLSYPTVLIMLITLILYFFPCYHSAYAESIEGKVLEVIDGNTFLVVTSKNDTLIVKLHGVDAPELGQAYGEKAKKYATKLCSDKKVSINIKTKDRKGIRLVTLTLSNNKEVSKSILKAGYGWVDRYGMKIPELKEIEQAAKQKPVGLWKGESPQEPWVYARNASMLIPKGR